MKNAGHLDLSKGLLKKKVKVLSLNSESVQRYRKLIGSKFQTDGVMRLKKFSPKHFRLHLGIFESSRDH